MAGEHDATEFIDPDIFTHKAPQAYAKPAPVSPFKNEPPPAAQRDLPRAPTREEVDRKVLDAQQKLAELKRAQEQLERERAALEEVRRRQAEFQTGRQEIVQNLTRGIALLEDAEFKARREAEQMARTMAEFRAALGKVQAIQDAAWSRDNFPTELTHALATVENARMEWLSARQKLPVLAGEAARTAGATAAGGGHPASLAALPFRDLCKLGLAFTLPLIIVGLLALGTVLFLLVHHKP